jgi:single-strand DNA-binding protein
MILAGVARLGRDAAIRYTPDGGAVASLSLAFNYGKKDDEGNRPTTWLDASLWGKLAEALEPYLKKGQQVSVTCDNVRIHTYERHGGGTGYAIKCDVRILELVGSSRPKNADPAAKRPEDEEPQGKEPPPISFEPDDLPF